MRDLIFNVTNHFSLRSVPQVKLYVIKFCITRDIQRNVESVNVLDYRPYIIARLS